MTLSLGFLIEKQKSIQIRARAGMESYRIVVQLLYEFLRQLGWGYLPSVLIICVVICGIHGFKDAGLFIFSVATYIGILIVSMGIMMTIGTALFVPLMNSVSINRKSFKIAHYDSQSLKIVSAVLAGGEKQRLSIARALWKNAHIIFADEPTASLDAVNRKIVTDLLIRHARRGVSSSLLLMMRN